MRKLLFPLLLLPTLTLPVRAEDLLQVYQLALERDPQLRAARSTRDSVAEGRPQAIADMLPNLSLSGEATRTDRHNKDTGASETYDSTTATLTLKQPVLHLEHWIELGKASHNTARADAEYDAAKQELIMRVAEAYFRVLSAKDTLSFARAEMRAYSRQLEQGKQRFDVGLIAVTDVHEAQAAYDLSRANEITAANDLENAWEALREIVNELSGSDLLGLRSQLPLSKPDPADIELWTKIALERNPNVIAAQNRLTVAQKTIASKRTGHLPTLDLVATSSETDTDYSAGTDLDTDAVSLQLTVPLFAGGKVLSQTRQAVFDFQTASEKLEQERRAIRRQVRDSYRGVESNISRVNALKAATVSAQSGLDATQAGFDVGTRTMVDVLNGQRDLYAARRDYAKARYDYLINGLSLKQAAGNLRMEDLQLVNSLLK